MIEIPMSTAKLLASDFQLLQRKPLSLPQEQAIPDLTF